MEKIVEENFVIKKIKNGDSSSFKILYEKYQSKLSFSILNSILNFGYEHSQDI